MPAYYELTNEQLAALPTKRLYNIYRKWQVHEGYANYHHGTTGQMEKDEYDERTKKCEFIKTELDNREHIER